MTMTPEQMDELQRRQEARLAVRVPVPEPPVPDDSEEIKAAKNALDHVRLIKLAINLHRLLEEGVREIKINDATAVLVCLACRVAADVIKRDKTQAQLAVAGELTTEG